MADGLHTKLQSIIGAGKKVYFQPDTNIKLTYPCIVYKMTGLPVEWADNIPYIEWTAYQVQYIYRDPDDTLVKGIMKHDLGFMSFSGTTVSSGVYTTTYQLITTLNRLDT